MKKTLFTLSIISFLVVANEDKSMFLSLFEDNDVKSAEEVFIFSYLADESKFLIKWEIEENYYLYLSSILIKQGSNIIDFEIDDANIIDHEDEFFGQTKIIRDSLKISLGNEINIAGTKVFYQGCADKGFCYPVQSKDLK